MTALCLVPVPGWLALRTPLAPLATSLTHPFFSFISSSHSLRSHSPCRRKRGKALGKRLRQNSEFTDTGVSASTSSFIWLRTVTDTRYKSIYPRRQEISLRSLVRLFAFCPFGSLAAQVPAAVELGAWSLNSVGWAWLTLNSKLCMCSLDGRLGGAARLRRKFEH